MKPFSLTYWRRFIAREWFPMAISLVLAIVLWSFVGGEKTVDKNVMIPVEVINLPRQLVISNQFKKEIEVAVNGPRSMILEIDNKKITRQIDLSKATPGTTVITNDVDSIPVPRGVTVLRVQPSTIILSLDKLIQKKFPINPVTAGTPSPGYILEGLRMDPEEITITGPETVLSQYQVLRTKVINVTGLSKSVQQQVPLELEPAIVDLIGETTITADISIALETVQKEFKVQLVPLFVDGERTLSHVKVFANVPKLLVDQKVDVDAMLTAVVDRDEEAGLGVVRINQANELTPKIEIFRIEPATVQFTRVIPPIEKNQEEAQSGQAETGTNQQ